MPNEPTCPKTVESDLGRGLVTLLTRQDRKFREWAKRVNLDEILESVKAKPPNTSMI